MSDRLVKRVLVVGSGVFGITAALELRRRGHRVTVLDQGAIPFPAATSNDFNRVVRADYGADDFFIELASLAIERWQDWNRTFGEPLYHEAGFLLLARAEMAPGTYEGDCFDRLRARGFALERMDAEERRARFPAWSAEAYPDGYFNPRAGWAEADHVLGALIGQAIESGCELREFAPVARLTEADDRITGVETEDGERVEADLVIVAVGPWTSFLLPELGDVMWPSCQPIVYFRPDDPSLYAPPRFAPWCADISRSGWYGISALPDGRVKVASHGEGLRVHPGETPLPAPAETEEIFRDFLSETLPGLASAPAVGSRLCVYSDSWDGDFWIDHDPERPGLLVCAGGSGHGFKFAPVLGEITADVAEGRENPWARRFRWRAPSGRRTEDARSDAILFGETG